ncbi:MAG: class I SAM-dependent methyltransferase [Desulfobacterales bacterium]|jgi:SAM-dependent methyltransferase
MLRLANFWKRETNTIIAKANVMSWDFRTARRRLRLRFKHLKQKHLFYQQIRRMIGKTLVKPKPGPVQSTALARATSAMGEKDVARMTDPDIYFESAYRWMRASLEALEKVNYNLRTLDTAMEMGCGSARLLRLLRCLPTVRLIGTDMNPVCVEWCQKNVPGAEFFQNEKLPPLAFAQDASIDLIIACSVFTHVSLDLQKPWLHELHRILRPGGIFLCTVLGQSYADKMLSAKDRSILERDGYVQLSPNHEQVSLSSHHTGQDDVFQTRDHLLESFGSVFDVLEYLERGIKLQNLLVLQKSI